MAQFCYECFKKTFDIDEPEEKYVISKTLYLCEGCGKLKKVVISERLFYNSLLYHFLVFSFRLIYKIFRIILKIVLLPYNMYRKIILKK